ncbi:uncharacterized protein LOC121542809 isoform X3 [Coregonus clupeaformis]|uniref:uncharacterized protein LOC121542809 isoform X3 n=1 Tax=Coregonus clupeaformis TaxID=59861 RepID=UPI001E1C8274|nr:uncharacterized protein LOC121542809 isoform X3 [Coregonus clupeaformis]
MLCNRMLALNACRQKHPKRLIFVVVVYLNVYVNVFTYNTMTCKRTKVSFQKRDDSSSSHHCCVPQCTVSARCNSSVSFFTFPKDSELHKRWVINIRRVNFLTTNTRVCSRHFLSEDVIEPPTPAGRRRLKKGAVPVLFQWNNFSLPAPRPGVWERTERPNTEGIQYTVAMEMAAEDIVIQETLGAEVELLEDVNKAHKQSPPEIPRVSVPCPFSMPEDSSDDDCDLSGDSVSAYGIHSMELGGKCWECGVQFKSGQELIEHFESHRSKVSTSCNICRVTFSRTISLAMHLVNAHPNSVLHCSSCQLHFSNLWDLNKHIGIHLFTELLNTPLEDISNNGLNSSEETLNAQCTVPSAVALKHEDNSNDCLNGSEETLNAQCTVPSAVALDHTYSMESNGRVTKTRHRLEESEEEEDVKPDPSILTPSLRIRVKLERGVEVDGAPLQWDEGMSDGEGSEHSEDTESAGGTDNDRLTESSGETDIDEEDIRLSEEEEEMKSKQGEDRKNDIQSEKEGRGC